MATRTRTDAAREAALRELGDALRGTLAAAQRLRGRETQLGDGRLGYAHYRLLEALEQGGELAGGELAQAAEISPATASQLLDHLAAHGIVERVRSTDDRRIVVSRLTPAGSAALAQKRANWQRRWRQALAGFDAEQLESAGEVLRELRTLLDGMGGD